MAIAIGITGSLGTGKTTVSLMFKDLGAKVFNADKIAHDLIKKGKPCYRPLIRLLGKQILTGERIDRKKVASIVFRDNWLLSAIESIIHPQVGKFIEQTIREAQRKKGARKIFIFEVPLLFESNLDALMDASVVVKATQEKQVERASKSLGITKRQALLRIKSQMPLKEKIQRADWVISNSKQLKDAKKQVKEIWQEILQIRK